MQKVASKSKMTITALLIAMILVLVAVVAVTTFGHDGGAVAQASVQVQAKSGQQYKVVTRGSYSLSALSSSEDTASDTLSYWVDNRNEDYYYFISVTGKDFYNGNNSYVLMRYNENEQFGFGLFNSSNGSSTPVYSPFFEFYSSFGEESLFFTDYQCSLSLSLSHI